jgi:hypothetical protein
MEPWEVQKQVHREYYLNWGIDVCEMDHIAQGVNLIHNEVRIPDERQQMTKLKFSSDGWIAQNMHKYATCSKP